MLKLVEEPTKVSQMTRFIGSFEGKGPGPTLVFFGGIHGNEPAGVKALEYFFSQVATSDLNINGAIFAIRGNIPALLEKKRYLEKDLNRLWSYDQLVKIEEKEYSALNNEEIELVEIKQIITRLLETKSPPFYFIDFHTTSSKTLPFITINDALINRQFSKQFPVPIILGIEEYLDGPLLSHMNELGYVSLGFESGQHNEELSVKNSISFIWLSLIFSGVLKKEEMLDFDFHFDQLKSAAKGNSSFYEVIHRHQLSNTDDFGMLNGFMSFQNISRGTLLAIQNKEKVHAEEDTILFMPLYQKQGAEGFFLIKKTPKWALSLSKLMRKFKFDDLLPLLPGISRQKDKKKSLLVNLSVARFFAKSFFLLLGYRNRQIDETHVVLQNREGTAKNKMYRKEAWY